MKQSRRQAHNHTVDTDDDTDSVKRKSGQQYDHVDGYSSTYLPLKGQKKQGGYMQNMPKTSKNTKYNQ